MTNSLTYVAAITASCLLCLPTACLMLFSAWQLQVVPGAGKALLFLEQDLPGWHLKMLLFNGPLCSLFICSYILCRMAACRRLADPAAAGRHGIWMTTFVLNLFLLATLFLYQ